MVCIPVFCFKSWILLVRKHVFVYLFYNWNVQIPRVMNYSFLRDQEHPQLDQAHRVMSPHRPRTTTVLQPALSETSQSTSRPETAQESPGPLTCLPVGQNQFWDNLDPLASGPRLWPQWPTGLYQLQDLQGPVASGRPTSEPALVPVSPGPWSCPLAGWLQPWGHWAPDPTTNRPTPVLKHTGPLSQLPHNQTPLTSGQHQFWDTPEPVACWPAHQWAITLPGTPKVAQPVTLWPRLTNHFP